MKFLLSNSGRFGGIGPVVAEEPRLARWLSFWGSGYFALSRGAKSLTHAHEANPGWVLMKNTQLLSSMLLSSP